MKRRLDLDASPEALDSVDSARSAPLEALPGHKN